MPNFTLRISATLVVLVLSASSCSDSATSGAKYAAVLAELAAIRAAHPSVAEVVSIGANDDGQSIAALRVSPSPSVSDPGRTGHLVVGTQHGDEGAAATLALLFARKLARQAADGTLAPAEFLAHEWLVVPVVNIPGFETGTREERGIDPNRDFPGPCTSDPGNRLASQRRLRELFDQRSFTGVVSLHGFVGTLTFPWGINTDQPHTTDHATFVTAASAAAAINGYQTGTSLDVVYAANGTFDDWAYWARGSYTLLVELDGESDADLDRTSDAMFEFFANLPATPSTSHAFTGSCLGRQGPSRRE